MDRGIGALRAHLARVPSLESLTVAEQRAQYDKAEQAFPVPGDVRVERVHAGGVPSEWLAPQGEHPNVAILYLHGGGYVIGSARSHRHLAAAVGAAADAAVLLPEYRLAPEHPFPAALEDAVAAYRWLLEKNVAPARLVIAGDSAGGGLTIATLVAVREAGLPLPAAAVGISPWTDLSFSLPSHATRAAVDPIVTREGVGKMAVAYLAGRDPKTPLASPLFADLRGLPPLLIQVGDDEVLLDDAVQLAERARQVGVDVTLEVAPTMVHVWHWFFPILDEGQQAIDRIGAFVRGRVK
ncbi:MAG: alpha/beta hydrolase [Candidatus Rokubacteria bacterium]|nr:alpha/beta hydrolase [Candidatus Rokubacteria bacterium]